MITNAVAFNRFKTQDQKPENGKKQTPNNHQITAAFDIRKTLNLEVKIH